MRGASRPVPPLALRGVKRPRSADENPVLADDLAVEVATMRLCLLHAELRRRYLRLPPEDRTRLENLALAVAFADAPELRPNPGNDPVVARLLRSTTEHLVPDLVAREMYGVSLSLENIDRLDSLLGVNTFPEAQTIVQAPDRPLDVRTMSEREARQCRLDALGDELRRRYELSDSHTRARLRECCIQRHRDLHGCRPGDEHMLGLNWEAHIPQIVAEEFFGLVLVPENLEALEGCLGVDTIELATRRYRRQAAYAREWFDPLADQDAECLS